MSHSTEHKEFAIAAGVLNVYGSRFSGSKDEATAMGSALLHRNIHAPSRYITSSQGSFINGGAAVACLAHGHKQIVECRETL
jgi:hypothetical protein